MARNSRGTHKTLNQLLRSLRPFHAVRPAIPLTHITAFLFVALDEGKGVGEYARMAGIHRAAMSRTLRDIGARNRSMGPGHGLVTVDRHPTEALKRQVFLTEKGRTIARQIIAALGKT